jgi:hypothetical protein
MCVGAISGLAQIAKKRVISKGPRAVALIQLAENGRAHLIPVAIMIDGRFYDASVYKADPVPLALQYETVYEGVKTGVSQGLFTVAGAAQNNGSWFADGKWQTKAQLDAEQAKDKAAREKKAQRGWTEAEIGGPPKLKRPGQASGKEAPSGSSAGDQTPAAKKEPEPAPKLERRTQESKDSEQAEVNDPNRPVLRRQPLSESSHEQTKASPETSPLKGPINIIPAISDPDGPQPRPYTYQMKPEEEQNFLKKMEAMATVEVNTRAGKSSEPGAAAPAGGKPGATSGKGAASGKRATRARSARAAKASASQLQFLETDMRVFDVSNTNEAVLVFTAGAKMPNASDDVEYRVVVAAREDIYGDLHKIFAQTTDNKHLDVTPKYELIDAVDADGDGRGELLFRETWDSGTSYSIYRVIGDRLWPLFEGKPSS